MRILILANNDVGLYKFRKELIQELLHQNNEVYISLPNGDLVQPLVDFGCKFIETFVDRRGINPITDMKLIVAYFRIMSKVKPDLVITYTIKPNIYGGFVSRIKKVPYAVNITGLGTAFQKEGFVKKLVVAMYKSALKKAKVVFFENKSNAKEMLDYHIVSKQQVCVLNGAGVNLKEYPFTEYPSEENGIRFLFIGRVMKEKGVNELFEAAKRIRTERQDIFFDIVGPMEEDYKDIIDDLVKKDIICYHGYQEDVKPFIRNCHCFVLPSWHEGMANTNLECAAMGRPLITSNIPGCRETVMDGASGFLFKPRDIDDLYDKLIEFINGICHSQMGKKSRAHIESFFDKEIIIESTLKNIQLH